MEGFVFVALVVVVVDLELTAWRLKRILELMERMVSKHERSH